MHRSLLALCGILTLAVQAQTDMPGRVATGFRQIREADLKADISFLASDALEGRLSLEPGDDAAAEWVASEFAKAGLEPACEGSYLQRVPLIEYRPDRAASFISIMRGGMADKGHRFPEAYGGFFKDVDVSAPVVFAGYGITAPELNYDDYRNIDARGKVVLVFDHEPQEDNPKSIFNGTGNTRHATTRVKALNAQAHGAAAILIVGEPNRNHPSNQERMARIGGASHRTIPLPSQAIDGDELQTPTAVIPDAMLHELLPNAAALQSEIDRTLKPQSKDIPEATVTLHYRNQSRRNGTTENVAGLLAGSDPKLKAETIIISGHHDHDGASGEEIWHGADDNASGTVGVVDLAHAFAANPVKPKRSILFVVFAAEERGLLGSFYMAAHPLRQLATTRAMINFDMIGRNEMPSEQTKGLIEIPADTSNRLNLIGGTYSPDYLHTVERENALVGLTLDQRFDHEAALNIFFRSDQFPFILKNVPAMWFFTGFHPDYHHTSDTPDKINYQKMAKILRLAYLTAFAFGDEKTPPKFVEDPGGS